MLFDFELDLKVGRKYRSPKSARTRLRIAAPWLANSDHYGIGHRLCVGLHRLLKAIVYPQDAAQHVW
eukprot:3700605-Rhodomonas_salina.2